ncbi:MAG: PAS domain S-box protein [Gemmatimonadetes bacterium]|nr:PAS domain S-box protein [Gemmatimonadota bacterium]
MHAVATVASGVLRCTTYEELDAVILSACQEILPHDAFTFGIYDPGTHSLRFLPGWDGEMFDMGAVVHLAGTPSEVVVRERRPMLTRRAAEQADAGVRVFGTQRRSQSIVRVPILSERGVLAVMSVQSYTPDAYDERDVEVMEVIAAVAASALQNIDLLEEQRTMEAALRASEEKFRTVVESLGEGICLTDLDDRVLYANSRLAEMLGYSQDELTGVIISRELAAPEDRAQVSEQHARRATGVSSRYQARYIRADGSPIWVEIHGTPMRGADGSVNGTVGVISEITVRKQAEDERRRHTAALAESEQRFRQVVDNIREVFWLRDTFTQRFLYVSPGYEEIWGRSVESLHARPDDWLDSVHEEDAAMVAAAMPRQASGEYDVEYRLVRPDGAIRWVRDRAFPVIEDAGAVVRIAGIAEDITTERARDEQLRRAERLAAVGTLVGGVAHELNNPLQAISGFADLMLEHPRTENDREALDTISREARRAARIVSELRLAARSSYEEMGPREAVDLNDVVRHVLNTGAFSLASTNIHVRQDLAASLPLLSADVSRLEQVVLNLVVNAAQALAGIEGERRIVVRTRRSRAGCSLSVYDNGTGIDAGHMPRLFDPFWTTKAPGEGTGLGLSVVHQIVSEHGGTVHVDSEPGRGTNFLIDLPLGMEPAAAPLGTAADPSTPVSVDHEGPPLRILVVDDEAALRRMMSLLGTRRGHAVDTAAEGEEALTLVRAAEAAEAPYDLVFSDLHMPGVSGRQFTERLLAHDDRYGDRLFLFTGAMDTPDIAWIREHTGVPILHKPFSVDDIVRVIAAAERTAQENGEQS